MHCCSTNRNVAAPVAPASNTTPGPLFHRIAALVQWVFPLTTLALIPKCPACIGGYALLFTGIGLSHSAATALRWILITLSIAALTYLFLRATRRALTPAA